jgi:hypothetical protein
MRLVRDRDQPRRLSLPALVKRPAHPRLMPVVPGALNQNATRVTVSGLGDPAALRMSATRMFTRNQSRQKMA